MPEPGIVVVGAGPAGLAVALSLARRGRPVTVLDRDPAQPTADPARAYETWSRPAVPHSPQPHQLLGRARRALRINAPDVLSGMLSAGAWENDLRARLVGDAARAGDEDLVSVAIRRPVFECVLRAAVEREPLVTLRPGTAVAGIDVRAQPSGPPRLAGVMVGKDVLPAEVVVDASGRRSPIRRWLASANVGLPPMSSEECGVVYYSRYFRLKAGVDYPPWVGAVGPAGTTDCLRFGTFFGDNGTFAFVLGVPSGDPALKALAGEKAWLKVAQRLPAFVPFLSPDISEPATGVMPMGALQNVFNPPLLDGSPPVLGLHFVGDSYCHTNPLFAWGLCLGLDYGFQLADILDQHPHDLEAQALAYAEASQLEVEQCFRAVAAEDRDRTLTWRGEQPSGPWLGRTFAGFVRQCATPAVMVDGEVARAVLRRANLLDLPDSLALDVGVTERITALQPALAKPPPSALPDRAEMVALIASA